jgi:hypothetical protein
VLLELSIITDPHGCFYLSWVGEDGCALMDAEPVLAPASIHRPTRVDAGTFWCARMGAVRVAHRWNQQREGNCLGSWRDDTVKKQACTAPRAAFPQCQSGGRPLPLGGGMFFEYATRMLKVGLVSQQPRWPVATAADPFARVRCSTLASRPRAIDSLPGGNL